MMTNRYSGAVWRGRFSEQCGEQKPSSQLRLFLVLPLTLAQHLASDSVFCTVVSIHHFTQLNKV